MPNAPPLSVIMPVHNCVSFVEAAVRSVLNQSFNDFEFLIVDDGSTDGTTDILRQLTAADPRIRLAEQENRGIVASVNRMVGAARGTFVARMDADDVSLPERFARQIAFLTGHPDVGAVGAQYVEIDERGHVNDPGIRHPTGVAAVRARMTIEQPFSNPTVMFRAEALRSVGGYREAFGACEDYDLFLRLSRTTALDNLPDVLLHYRRSAGQMSVANNSAQTHQAVMAVFAHQEVLAGRPDPFVGVSQIPSLDRIDQHVGRAGVAQALRGEIAARLRFSPMALRGAEFALMLDHARSGDSFLGGWRTVLRCVSLGLWSRAVRLAAALMAGQRRLGRHQSGDEKAVDSGDAFAR
ncbi:MAG: glycosyltransferase [Sphingopyxis sp.]|nr:glycosyltransferase [Sphingopyxis sp.]